MKNKQIFFILLLLLSAFLIYSFYAPSSKTTNTTGSVSLPLNPPPVSSTDKFIITGLDCGYWYNNEYNIELNYTDWHSYTNAVATWMPSDGWEQLPVLNTNMPYGIDRYTNFAGGTTGYGQYVSSMITANRNDGMRTIMDRPKIQYTTQGQRSDYQCETESYLADPDYWSYTYNVVSDNVSRNYTDNTQWGNGVRVRYCRTGNSTNGGDWTNTEGYVVSGLKANREQANLQWNYTQRDTVYEWYIMPRIRIPVGLPDNTPVCRVEVYNWDSIEIVSVTKDILASHFRKNISQPYNGRYLDGEFYFTENQDPFSIEVPKNTISFGQARAFEHWNEPDLIKTDFRVWWYGQCDMWIDYIRVENLPAHRLFKGELDQDIKDEVDLALTGYNLPGYVPNHFYHEEFEFNTTPCIRYVNNIIKQRAAQFGVDLRLIMNLNHQLYTVHNPGWAGYTPQQIKKFLIDGNDGIKDIAGVIYPFEGWDGTETDAWGYNNPSSLPVAKHPNTLTTSDYNKNIGLLSNAASPEAYDLWLQQWLDKPDHNGMITLLKFYDQLLKLEPELKMTMLHQSHLWWCNRLPVYKLKEPTNEEINLMANLAVSFGIKGIQYFWQWSFGNYTDPYEYAYGIMGPGVPPSKTRVTAYGQVKYQQIKNTSANLKNWSDYLMQFNNSQTHSYVYRLERNNLINQTYFKDVVAYKKPFGPPVVCSTPDSPDTTDAQPPQYLRADCYEDTYLQVATFKKSTDDGNKYFMVVNRRCSPHVDETSEDNYGGKRFIRVFFDQNAGDLAGFSNWNIYNLESDPPAFVTGVNITSGNPYADLGYFAPGEGKLYKIVPTFKSGGTLAGNEVISGQSFTCEDTVISNGYNITINGGSTISFTDSAAIIMNGGTFTSGALNEGTSQTTYKGSGSNKWNGLQLNGATVKIYNSKFQDISSPVINYAVKMVNCPLADIRTNQFVMSSDTSGAVQSVYIDGDGLPSFQCLYIAYNSITMNNSRANGVMVQGFSGLTLPVYIMNNTMTSNGYAQGVMLSSVTGGSVKNNSITGFATGINSLLSTVNVFNNTITNTTAQSKGMLVTGSASLSLVPSGGLWLGGFNTVTNTYGASVNIEANNSVFVLGGGKNTFDVTSSAQSYHLYGSSYSSRYSSMANDNCFKLSGTEITSPNLPRDSVLNGSNEITFNYNDYLCGPSLPESQTIINLGNGLYDTIPGSGGEGAGRSSVNTRLPLDKGEKQRGSEITTTPSAGGHPLLLKSPSDLLRRGQFTLTPKAMYDTVRVRLAKQNYAGVKSACYDLINAYPDSMQSILSLQTLYLSAIMTDTTYSGLSQLKTFYETLILEHPDNTAMVRISNYMAQKCKVMLKQYTSALAGFQQIINNNPYSYEGLAAKWDYMATSLLAPGGGGENSKPEIRNPNYDENVESVPRTDTKEELYWGDDKNPFTKEEKQQIISSVKNAFEQAKNDDEVKIQKLEEAAETGDINAEKELNTMKTLKQIVRTEKPHNIMEHINIVSSDVQKVFGNTQPAAETKTTAIPQVFSLSQNFPNPFNPVTTIKYALPKDVKVVVKIYDILGREVKILVNDFQTAGYYDVKFDMSSYASGVYFYRIEVRQDGSSTVDFVQSKKMVLVK